MSTHFECTIPILRVHNIQESLAYYQSVLGFQRDWGGDEANSGMASVSRDHCSIMLCSWGQGHFGTWVWIGVEDVEPLYRDYQSKGVKIILPPTNYFWALEMRIEDPNGHILRFGSEPLTSVPFVDPNDG